MVELALKLNSLGLQARHIAGEVDDLALQPGQFTLELQILSFQAFDLVLTGFGQGLVVTVDGTPSRLGRLPWLFCCVRQRPAVLATHRCLFCGRPPPA